MACPNLPDGKVREIIERTVETGNEHGFVVCGDGSMSDVVEGGKSKMKIEKAVKQCDLSSGEIDIVHTHPNGVKKLSKPDRQVAAHDKVGSVCVAVDGGDIVCESVESCDMAVGK